MGKWDFQVRQRACCSCDNRTCLNGPAGLSTEPPVLETSSANEQSLLNTENLENGKNVVSLATSQSRVIFSFLI